MANIWSDDDVIKLVKELKKYPDFPRNTDEEGIQSLLNKPWLAIKAKWNNMRQYNNRCRINHLQTRDKPKWKFYDLMNDDTDFELRSPFSGQMSRIEKRRHTFADMPQAVS